jgi:murein DD-endopeptidase MepM/ murein hydrolase activator NlpD
MGLRLNASLVASYIHSLIVVLFVIAVFFCPMHIGADEVKLLAPDSAYVGEIFQVTVSSSQKIEGVTITWLNKEITLPVDESGSGYAAEVLLGTDVLRQKKNKEVLGARCGLDSKILELHRVIALTSKEYPVQRLTLPEAQVTPPEEAWGRIKSERGHIRNALNTISQQRFWTFPFAKPVSGEVSSIYGVQRILNGKPRWPHRGVDLRAHVGTPVKACNGGQVVLIGDHYYAGKSVYLDHGLGLISMYFHLSRTAVHLHQRVRKGDVIGFSGQSGRATGPHLHFGLSTQGQLVDPMPLFEEALATGSSTDK